MERVPYYTCQTLPRQKKTYMAIININIKYERGPAYFICIFSFFELVIVGEMFYCVIKLSE